MVDWKKKKEKEKEKKTILLWSFFFFFKLNAFHEKILAFESPLETRI